MAIYSCNLTSVGRTTHQAGTAGAHLRYIARPEAQPVLDGHAMPLDAADARTWMDRAEAADRKNARVMDKIRVALPRELDEAQRTELVRDFCQGITGDRVPWMFAIHQSGKDAHNPHAHIVIRDRDLETGKRVLRLSDNMRDREAAGLEPKAVEWIRERWEHHANLALEQAGHEVRIDRRSLEAQGIDREPTIHIGPRAQHIDGHVQRPDSKIVKTGNGREIDYPMIDAGRTRKERQAEIIDMNLERAARSPDFETREWAVFEKQQRAADRVLDAELTAEARRRTLEERRLRSRFREEGMSLRQARDADCQARMQDHRAEHGAATRIMRDRHAQEQAALSKRHGQFWSRALETVDITGGTRRRKADEKRAQEARQRYERRQAGQQARANRQAIRDDLQATYAPQADAWRKRRSDALSALRSQQRAQETIADDKRQAREAEREQGRQRVAQAIQDMKRHAKAGGDRSGDRARQNFDAATKAQDQQRMESMRDELRKQRDRRGRGPGLGR